MPDTTLTLAFLLVAISFVAVLMVAPRRMFETGHTGLGEPFRLLGRGVLRVVAWFATGLATYGLVFGYSGSSASVLMDSRNEDGSATDPSERGLAAVGKHLTHAIAPPHR